MYSVGHGYCPWDNEMNNVPHLLLCQMVLLLKEYLSSEDVEEVYVNTLCTLICWSINYSRNAQV